MTPPGLDEERASTIATVTARLLDGGRALLVGEPGVGKTHTFEAIIAELESRGVRVLATRGAHDIPGEPHQGLIDLLADVSPAQLARIPPFQRLAIEIALARSPATVWVTPLALRVGFAAVINLLLESGPVVIAVDDVSTLDAPTAELVRYVASRRALGVARAALLGTLTSDALLSGHHAPRDSRVFAIHDITLLRGLSLSVFRSTLESSGFHNLPAQYLNRLFAVTGGNPRWAAEFAAFRREFPPGMKAHGPVFDLVDDRLDAMNPKDRAAFQMLAALSSTTIEQLRPLIDDDALARIVAAGLVAHRANRLSPAHPLVAALALRQLRPDEARKIHQLIAERSPTAWQRADHLDQATAEGFDGDLARALSDGSVDLAQSGDTAAAAKMVERSVDRSTPGTSAFVSRVVSFAELAYRQGDFGQTITGLQRISIAALPIDDLDRVLPLFVDVLVATRGESAADAALTAIETEGGAADGSNVHAAIYAINHTGEFSRQLARDRARLTDALALLTSAGVAPHSQQRALGLLINARLDAGEALDASMVARTAALPTPITVPRSDYSELELVWSVEHTAEDLESPESVVSELRRRATLAGETVRAGLLAIHLARIAVQEGRLDDATAFIESFDASDPTPTSPSPLVVATKGMLALSRGDTAAICAIEETGANADSSLRGTAVRLSIAGMLAARGERWTEAVESLTRARELFATAGVADPSRRHLLDSELGEAQIATGDLVGASATIDWVREVAERGDSRVLTGIHLRLDGLLAAAQGRSSSARTLLEQSLRVLNESNHPSQAVRSQFELGRLHRRLRERGAAGEILRDALTRAEQVADQPLVRRITEELLLVLRRGGSTLTATERQIAVSASNGDSNRQIASETFSSVRTIESHLSSVYRKTGLASRLQLAGWLNDHEPEAVTENEVVRLRVS
jgi:DNA-binding CsgD family transcriptional regulator